MVFAKEARRLAKQAQGRAAKADVRAALRRVSADVTVDKTLKVASDRQVFLGSLRGQPVVLKRFIEPDAHERLAKARAELELLEKHMSDGPYQVMRYVAGFPEIGVLAVSVVPGDQLSRVLAAAPDNTRQRLIAQSGCWLGHYAQGRTSQGRFGAGFWVQQMKDRDLGMISERDMCLAKTLMGEVARRATLCRGQSVTRGAVHGDFVPTNLHFDEGTLYGIDIQGECNMALAREAARFLVWLRQRQTRPPVNQRYGICLADLEAFLSSRLLPIAEQDTVLPVFIGELLHLRFVESCGKARRQAVTRDAIEAYLADG